LDFYPTILEFIELRSFANLWYWIALAAIWTQASHYALGVPADMVGRAARHGGRAMDDLEDLVRIRVQRILGLARTGGAWLVGATAALLTALALLAFRYGLEFGQAVFFIVLPLSLVGLLSIRTAGDIEARAIAGPELCRRIGQHRLAVQTIAMASIFVTTLWGMYRNLSVGPFGI
jgi:hypothetical protein